MSEKRCPSEVELLSFADADLSPEQLKRVEKHLELCSGCARRVISLHELIADIAAPVGSSPLDMTAHVAGVMERLDSPAPAKRSRWAVWSGGIAAAAALVLWSVTSPKPPVAAEAGGFTPRGAPSESRLSRYVGLQLYARGETLQPLTAGSRVHPNVALTAGVRNLGGEQVHLLLFAVDSRAQVHWIAPEYARVGSDPQALAIAPGEAEQLLPSAAVFDDLAPGRLRVVAVITREPMRVSAIEALSAEALSGEHLMARFERAEIRQFLLDVAAVTP